MNKARKLLSGKNSGPSGILAFMMANAHTNEVTVSSTGKAFGYIHPYVDETSDVPLVPYYGVINNNRTGLEVSVPPGGTQDLIFDLDGVETYAELVKPKKQLEFLQSEFGIELTEINDEAFVSELLSQPRVSNLELEDAFFAAARETKEEHGWDYFACEKKLAFILETDQELLSKRSFSTNPPTPVSQKIFVAKVTDFDGVEPVRTDKIETKIPDRMGCEFFEQGDFRTLEMMQVDLEWVQQELSDNPNKYPEIAHIDAKATASRVKMIERIERTIIMPRLG